MLHHQINVLDHHFHYKCAKLEIVSQVYEMIVVYPVCVHSTAKTALVEMVCDVPSTPVCK